MKTLKNIIVIEKSQSIRDACKNTLIEYGYDDLPISNIANDLLIEEYDFRYVVFALTKTSNLSINFESSDFDDDISTVVGSRFLELLKERHEPAMRWMTKYEIYKLYRENDRLWIKHQYGKEWVSRISQISPNSDEAFFTWEGWAEWQTYNSLVKNFKYATDKHPDDWHEFEVEE